jgi:hypothetical protein
MSNKITLLYCISEEERKKKSRRSVMIFIQCYAILLLSGNSGLGITTKIMLCGRKETREKVYQHA